MNKLCTEHCCYYVFSGFDFHYYLSNFPSNFFKKTKQKEKKSKNGK